MQTDFKSGQVVWAKTECLETNETQHSTMGVVLDYNPNNDYLKLGVLNPQDYLFPPIFNARGCFYELVPHLNKEVL
jgi:hypothetical protein